MPEIVTEITPTGAKRKFGEGWQCAILLFLYVFPCLVIALGARYLGECPAQKMLPIGLVVLGSVWIFSTILSCPIYVAAFTDSHDYGEKVSKVYLIILWILELFLVGWYITCCDWLYNAPFKWYAKRGEEEYCDQTLYYTAFWGNFFGALLMIFKLYRLCFR